MSSRSRRDQWLSVGGLSIRFICERGPFGLGVMVYGLRRRTPQAWLYLSSRPTT